MPGGFGCRDKYPGVIISHLVMETVSSVIFEEDSTRISYFSQIVAAQF